MGKTSKVVVCGAKKCGKTSILEQAIYGAVGPFNPTLEDIYVANVDTDRGTRERLRFIDTEGLDEERVKEVPRHLLAIADGFLIVYSIDEDWYPMDCFVRLSVDDKFMGSGWFNFGPDYAECETNSVLDGRVTQRIDLNIPLRY